MKNQKSQIVKTVRFFAAALLVFVFLAASSSAQETKEEYFGRQITALTAKINGALNNDKLYVERANAYFELQKYARATADIDKALQLNPKNSEALEFQKKLLRAAYSDPTGTVAAQYQEDLKSMKAEAAAKNSGGKTSAAGKAVANNSPAVQTAAAGESEFDKIMREENIVITPEQKRQNARQAKEMADATIKNPAQYDKLLEIRETRKEFYEIIQLVFRQQEVSKKFAEFDAAYRKPLSDQQRLEMLNQIMLEYQKALKETEALEKPTFNFSADEKSKIAENKTYYAKVLSILSPMKAAIQPPSAQTNAFSQADVDQFNKQNPNVGQSSANSQQGAPESGDPQIAVLTAKIADAPNDDKLYAQRAALHFKIGKFAAALADADKALGINSQNYNALFFRGLTKGSTKDFDGAIADFSQVIKISPNRAAAGYFQRGRIYEQKSDFSKALADYDQAAALDPKAAEAATKARLRVAARMNAAQSGTSVGGALTQMKNEMEAKNAELRKLRQFQEKFEALQKEAAPFLAKLQATAADDRENQRINRAALLPKAQAVRNYLADAIVELAEYKSPEGQKLRETFIGVFKSVNGAIEKLY